ncbi:DNA cytosine methyltransferase [Latilactobacillus fuchuensis]|uniref:DNA cytosine methyltransferase n=1 Tax=Latilactobacillus fuchuensis TaxID=164393 RepID=UPI0020C7808E|nr:DNA cytosine methyltransferase [Latilactobacillus fuchuensis]MCP8856872.1 DNA cytosine methyltransferase [Latilactobacillus fuchuensis]
MKMISLFAGVGGIDIGFSNAGDFETVYANEVDKNARKTYTANFGDTLLDGNDIRNVQTSKLPNADIVLAGFPCQPFSIAGYRKGLEDERGDLFFEALRIIKAVKPGIVFLENVKNLVTHDHGNTFKVIREFLVHSGYYIKWKVLNSKDYGNIPQNRERIYIVGFTNIDAYEQFEFPEKIPLTTKLSEVIKFNDIVDRKYYYTEEKQTFYPELKEAMTSQDTVYQWRRQYVRENKSGVVPTLTANMGTGGHNVPLILTDSQEIRKLTPRETFNVQGYPQNYTLPDDEANGPLYKQAGNSVSIPVITRIAEQILKVSASSNIKNKLPQTNDKFAILKTTMIGRMEGSSYPIDFFNSTEEAKNYIDNSKKLSNLELYTDEEFFNVVNKNKQSTFMTIIG